MPGQGAMPSASGHPAAMSAGNGFRAGCAKERAPDILSRKMRAILAAELISATFVNGARDDRCEARIAVGTIRFPGERRRA